MPSSRLCKGHLRHVQHEGELGLFTFRCIRERHEQCGIEDAVALVAGLCRKVELGSENRLVRRLHAHVNVARAAGIDARHDGLQHEAPRVVGKLMAAKVVALVVVDARVVGVPEIKERARNGRTPGSKAPDPLEQQPRTGDTRLEQRGPQRRVRRIERPCRLRWRGLVVIVTCWRSR